jgi:hypothetical protein
MQGRGSGKVRDFAVYGETTGEADEFGLAVRYNWAAEYRDRAMVVYGHTPVPSQDRRRSPRRDGVPCWNAHPSLGYTASLPWALPGTESLPFCPRHLQ